MKLIQIILVGQPELRDSVDHPALRQLRQRIAFRFHLGPLDEEQTREYVHHRLRVAGPLNEARFSDRALKDVYAYSGGIPRLVNLACDKALLVAFTEDVKKIDHKIVLAGLREIEGPDLRSEVARRARRARRRITRPSASPSSGCRSSAAAPPEASAHGTDAGCSEEGRGGARAAADDGIQDRRRAGSGSPRLPSPRPK